MPDIREMVDNHQKETQALIKERERQLQEREYKEKKEKLDARIQKLANDAAERCMKYGEDDEMYNMLLGLLEMSLQMQDMMNVMDDLKVATGMISDVMELIDQSVEFDEQLFYDPEVKYGLRQRMQQRRQMRRAIRNNRNRVKAVVENMRAKYEMGMAMSRAMTKSFSGIKSFGGGRRKKKHRAGGSGGRARELVMANLNNGNGGAANAGNPSNPGTGSGSIDIGDIT